MNVNEILNDMCGLDQRRMTKSALTLENGIFNFTKKETEVINSITLNKPAIEIEKHGDLIQIDICFVSSMDNDLKILWNNVELYGKNMNDLDADIRSKKLAPISSLTIVPTKYNGQYFAVGTNPIFWALTSKKMGQNANVVRLLYKVEDFKFYQNDDIDIEALKADVRQEIIYENRQKASAEREAQEINDFNQQ